MLRNVSWILQERNSDYILDAHILSTALLIALEINLDLLRYTFELLKQEDKLLKAEKTESIDKANLKDRTLVFNKLYLLTFNSINYIGIQE